jgi:hypothetical protein
MSDADDNSADNSNKDVDGDVDVDVDGDATITTSNSSKDEKKKGTGRKKGPTNKKGKPPSVTQDDADFSPEHDACALHAYLKQCVKVVCKDQIDIISEAPFAYPESASKSLPVPAWPVVLISDPSVAMGLMPCIRFSDYATIVKWKSESVLTLLFDVRYATEDVKARISAPESDVKELVNDRSERFTRHYMFVPLTALWSRRNTASKGAFCSTKGSLKLTPFGSREEDFSGMGERHRSMHAALDRFLVDIIHVTFRAAEAVATRRERDGEGKDISNSHRSDSQVYRSVLMELISMAQVDPTLDVLHDPKKMKEATDKYLADKPSKDEKTADTSKSKSKSKTKSKPKTKAKSKPVDSPIAVSDDETASEPEEDNAQSAIAAACASAFGNGGGGGGGGGAAEDDKDDGDAAAEPVAPVRVLRKRKENDEAKSAAVSSPVKKSKKVLNGKSVAIDESKNKVIAAKSPTPASAEAGREIKLNTSADTSAFAAFGAEADTKSIPPEAAAAVTGSVDVDMTVGQALLGAAVTAPAPGASSASAMDMGGDSLIPPVRLMGSNPDDDADGFVITLDGEEVAL